MTARSSQLMREAKYLQRMGIEVPESAKMVLLQEDKFKRYYNQLSHALKEYDRVMSAILPVAKPLLGPHLDDLEKKLAPGMYILTWTSMNIDGYLDARAQIVGPRLERAHRQDERRHRQPHRG